MNAVTGRNFGILIAYLVPGFVVLWSLREHSEIIRSWLGSSPTPTPTVGGFLYGTVASLALGIMVSTVRWLVIDAIHHHTGLREPTWDFSRLQMNLAAFEAAVENHYRYYQFYGNMLVAMIIAAIGGQPLPGLPLGAATASTAVVIFLTAVLFVASRDALRKHYARTAMLLGLTQWRKETTDDERMARNAVH